MFAVGNLFQALGSVTNTVLEIVTWLIIIRALLSWVSPDPSNSIVQFIERTTEPILQPFRSLIPSYKIGIDLSPLLAILALHFLKIFLVRTLFDLAARF